MVVNKKFVALVYSLFFISGVYATGDISSTSTQQFLEKNMNTSLVALGNKIEVCRAKEDKNTIYIVPKSMKEANITIDDFRIATMALNYRNNAQCIENELNNYMYHTLVIYKLQHKRIEHKEILESVFLSLPSEEIVEALASYAAFPPHKKEYFQKHIGNEPFDIIKVSAPVYEAFRK